MSDSVLIDGTEYISSKRAAELCGYAQDYVGQLARSGKIDARRAAGHWYVNPESLKDHTQKAELRIPATRPEVEVRAVDTIVGLDGMEYVSAGRASMISGYHQDYIGQLARASTVKAQQVGNRWYVDLQALLAHKEEKDELLAAVQVASVGLKKESDRESVGDALVAAPPIHYSYLPETTPLLPQLIESKEPLSDWDDNATREDSAVTSIPIRVHRVASARSGPPRRTFDMTGNNLVKSGIVLAAMSAIGGIIIGINTLRLDGSRLVQNAAASLPGVDQSLSGVSSMAQTQSVETSSLRRSAVDMILSIVRDSITYAK